MKSAKEEMVSVLVITVNNTALHSLSTSLHNWRTPVKIGLLLREEFAPRSKFFPLKVDP